MPDLGSPISGVKSHARLGESPFQGLNRMPDLGSPISGVKSHARLGE